MADYRRHYDEEPRRPSRDGGGKAGDRVRSWFDDDNARRRHGNDERDDRFPYGGERNGGHDDWRTQAHPSDERDQRGARWDGPRDERDRGYYASQTFGSYRTDDRPYHDRYRGEHERDGRHHDPRLGTAWNAPQQRGRDAAADYFRAAREQRDDLQRYEAESPGAEFEDRADHDRGSLQDEPWARERGGHWQQRGTDYAGRGPKDYRRSDERVREEICDCMTDDPMLDASDISVQVKDGVVVLSGSVSSREQKRRAEDVAERMSGVKDVTNQLRVAREATGHAHAAARPVAQPEPGTPGKSSSTTT